jgi:phosphopantetheinyl transferase (holo-ACP synthase)
MAAAHRGVRAMAALSHDGDMAIATVVAETEK